MGTFLPVLLAIGLFGLMLLATSTGIWLGARRERVKAAEDPLFSTVRGGVLGFLALLIGFSYSGATGRFLDRQKLIVDEANAIRTSYLRADLLDEPERKALRSELRTYRDLVAQLLETIDIPRLESVERQCEATQGEIWAAALRGARKKPAMTLAVLNPLEDLINVHATRVALVRRHMPLAVTAALIVFAVISLAMIGYGAGERSKGRATAAGGMALLIAIAMWLAIDMDYPRVGLIRIDQDAITSMRLDR